jgi:uncharacterized protein (TIGR02118 family)
MLQRMSMLSTSSMLGTNRPNAVAVLAVICSAGKLYQLKEIEMIKMSIFYPNQEGSKFDMDYYCKSHMPMIQQKLGAACKGVAIEQGLAGATPGSRAVYVAMGHFYFDSVEAFQAAFGPHAQAIIADVPNFTDIQSTVQLSEVKT